MESFDTYPFVEPSLVVANMELSTVGDTDNIAQGAVSQTKMVS